MLCKRCGEKYRFTMIKETEVWCDKEKKFKPISNGAEYYVCDNCMNHNGEGGHIDTEGQY